MESVLARHTKLFSALLACFILTIPLNNCYEIYAMMNGTLASVSEDSSAWSIALTPIYIKGIKDIFFLLSVLLFIATWIKTNRNKNKFGSMPFILLNVFILIVALTAIYSMSFMPMNIVLMGVRGYWAVGFVYIGAMYHNIDERKLYLSIVGVFMLDFLLQVVQFITDVGHAVYFEHRSPGMFIIPATAGAFALLVHYVAIKLNSTAIKVLSFLSLVMSNSTTGLLIFALYYFYSFRNKIKPKFLYYPMYLTFITAAGYALVSHLGQVTGRGEGASYSALIRFELFITALTNWTSLIFGQGMGVATSQAVISGYSNSVIADNTYVGIIYNAGIVPSLIMLAFVLTTYRYFENKILFLIFTAYSMTTVIFEINPIIQIVLILLGVQIGRRNAERLILRKMKMPRRPHERMAHGAVGSLRSNSCEGGQI
jgi:hypothetical protein